MQEAENKMEVLREIFDVVRLLKGSDLQAAGMESKLAGRENLCQCYAFWNKDKRCYGGKWDSVTAKQGTYNDNDPIGVLDVTISSNLILDEILGIKDLRSDKRIDFVGGIRGLGELQRRVDSGEMKVALALYPVTMKQLMDIADTGNIMPPKTTWFEPKLRSGLVIHKLE